MSKKKTKQDLLEEIAKIEADPKNKNREGSMWAYKHGARKKIDNLRREIASIIRTEKIARGEKIDDSGYSGRQSNKR